MKGEGGGRLDIVSILGGKPSEDGDGEESSKDMACKALFKAIKRDDYEGFKVALNDFLEYREEDAKSGESGEKKPDKEADDGDEY